MSHQGPAAVADLPALTDDLVTGPAETCRLPADAEALRSDIEAYARVRSPIAAAAELSAAEAERLRALGYLGPAAASASAD